MRPTKQPTGTHEYGEQLMRMAGGKPVGYGQVPAGVTLLDNERVVKIARAALLQARRTVAQLEDFLAWVAARPDPRQLALLPEEQDAKPQA